MSEDMPASEDSDSEGDLDEYEDLKKLIVKEEAPSEVKEGVPVTSEKAGEEISITPTPEELEEEQKVRQEVLASEKEEQLSAKEEELKKEEERRDKMRVLLSGYLELKTKKEIEKAMLNEKKIIAQWLYPFREAYQKEWQLEMTKLRLAFEKALDYKKAHIHAIQRERKLCELNHLWADCAHYQISEELFEFMRKRCDKLKEKYLEELEETKRYYLERENQILDKCTKAEERANLLECLRRNIHENILKHTKETLENYKNQGVFLKEKEMDLIDAKHMTYVEKIAEELQMSISPPEHKMEEIRQVFDDWKKKYETFTEFFAKNKKEMQVVSEEIPILEKRVVAARKKLEDMRQAAKRQKQIQMEEIIRLQTISKRYDKIRPPLRQIISDSERVMVQLRDRKLKLEKIKKLKKFCDKLESECDTTIKDIPFIDESERKKMEENDCLTFIREICSDDIEDQKLLENLNRKVSRVKFQNRIIERSIEKLKSENKALKSDMKKYLQKIADGEYERIPEEFQFETDSEGTDKEKEEEGTKVITEEDIYQHNLELLKQKCNPINSLIIKNLERKSRTS